MTYSTIVCLDDLTRPDFWPAKEFMYDLIRLPIHHASGIDIACSPRQGHRHNLLPAFSDSAFLDLCRAGAGTPDWATLYHRVPPAAADYLARHIPDEALVISYEMTPWLRAVLEQRGCDWLDIRLAPLRFASDLYLAVRGNRPALTAALQKHAVSADAVHHEAMLLMAQVRHRRRYAEDNLALDDHVVYIGQTEADAALVNAHGRFARIGDYRAKLLEVVGDSALTYRAHPDGGAFADREQQQIERFVGRPIARCDVETYDLLAGDANVRLVGLSSGTLQEAQWFGREATSMLTPVCEPAFDADALAGGGYLLIAPSSFVSEPLWTDLVAGGRLRPGAVAIAPRANMMRELHNAWWGYSSVTIRHSHFHRQVMDFHGGSLREQQVETKALLEQAQKDIHELKLLLGQTQQALAALTRERGILVD